MAQEEDNKRNRWEWDGRSAMCTSRCCVCVLGLASTGPPVELMRGRRISIARTDRQGGGTHRAAFGCVFWSEAAESAPRLVHVVSSFRLRPTTRPFCVGATRSVNDRRALVGARRHRRRLHMYNRRPPDRSNSTSKIHASVSSPAGSADHHSGPGHRQCRGSGEEGTRVQDLIYVSVCTVVVSLAPAGGRHGPATAGLLNMQPACTGG